MAARLDARPPWKRKNPKNTSASLSRKQKSQARMRARAAGRKYPNLVDNMAVARKRNTSRSGKRGTAGAVSKGGRRR
jgi:hypothetical protein